MSCCLGTALYISGLRDTPRASLAAAGEAGVERALTLMRTELERDMRLMGCTSVAQLSRKNLRFRTGGRH